MNTASSRDSINYDTGVSTVMFCSFTIPRKPTRLGRDFAEILRCIWAEPFASEAIARFRHTLKTGEPYAAPSTVQRRQDIGAVEAYDWRIERVDLPDGRFGVVCYFYDLSERQRWEAALRESERRLRTFFESDMVGTIYWNMDGQITDANDRFLRMVGYSRKDLAAGFRSSP